MWCWLFLSVTVTLRTFSFLSVQLVTPNWHEAVYRDLEETLDPDGQVRPLYNRVSCQLLGEEFQVIFASISYLNLLWLFVRPTSEMFDNISATYAIVYWLARTVLELNFTVFFFPAQKWRGMSISCIYSLVLFQSIYSLPTAFISSLRIFPLQNLSPAKLFPCQ